MPDLSLRYPLTAGCLSHLKLSGSPGLAWSFHSFVGQMENERTVPNHIYGACVVSSSTVVDGLEVGFSDDAVGWKGLPINFSIWVDAFLSQDNFILINLARLLSQGQLAGIDLRWAFLMPPWLWTSRWKMKINFYQTL